MGKLKNKFESIKFSIQTGAKVKVIDQEVEEVVIRYKDLYFYIYLDIETGEPTHGEPFGWSHSPMTNVPIRDFYIAQKGDSRG